MTLTDGALIIGSIAAGLFSGLMLALVVILHHMWSAMAAEEYITAMQAFLPVAKGHPVITAITLLPIIAPLPALIAQGINLGDQRFVLTFIGVMLACIPLFVTLRFNFPIYATIMSWQASQPAADWKQMRHRFLVLNLIRLSFGLGAMLAFLLALTT